MDALPIVATSATVFYTKVLIDIIRRAYRLPGRIVPLLAVVLGVVVALLLLLYDGASLSSLVLIEALFRGIVTGTLAVGTTELQTSLTRGQS